MNKTLLSVALAGALSAGFAHAADENADAKEKCYGIAKAGKNDCASASGSHACMGMAPKDKMPDEWKYSTKEECAKEGGKLEAPKS